MSAIDWLIGILIFSGLCLLFIPPVIQLSNNKKLLKDDYTLNVFLPTTIGLIAFFIAILLNFNMYYDERKIGTVSAILAIGGIGIALMASHFSELRVYYAT
jgi:putative effector of murein hydrolase LrgA (UPF0299 family)